MFENYLDSINPWIFNCEKIYITTFTVFKKAEAYCIFPSYLSIKNCLYIL